MDGLWEVPILEPAAGVRGVAAGTLRLAAGGPRVRLGAPIGSVRHTVTYRRIEVEIVTAAVLSEPHGGRYRWVDRKALARLPVSSLVGKILARVGTDREKTAGAAAPDARRASRRPRRR
jgi:adenine-specific DNA glycosylase